MRTRIYIKGALNSKLGDEGFFIGRSEQFEDHQLDLITELDKPLQWYLESRNDPQADSSSIMSRHIEIDQRRLVMIIRICKNFTTFPEFARAYHRREYYFFEHIFLI